MIIISELKPTILKSMRDTGPSLRLLLIMTTLIITISCLHHLHPENRQRLHRQSSERHHRVHSSHLDDLRISHHLQTAILKQSHGEEEQASGLVNISPNSFKNNLRNLNWYYGSITPSEYRVRLFVAATKQNMSSCPYNRPYVTEKDMQTCFQCQDLQPLYNLGSGECQPCPEGSPFDKYLGNCSAIANGTTPENGEEEGQSTQKQGQEGEEVSGIEDILSAQKEESKKQAEEQAQQQKEQQGKGQLEKEQREQDELLSAEELKQKQQQAAKQKKLDAEQAKKQLAQKQQQKAAVDAQKKKDKEDEDQYKEEQKEEQKQEQENDAERSSQQQGGNGTSIEGETDSETDEGSNETHVYNCTSDAPLFIDNKCKACPELNEYFPDQNLCKQKVYSTNPNAKNIILPSWKYLQEQDLKLQKVNQGRIIYQCPIDYPYLINAKCQKCQDHFYYDASQQSCVNDCEEYTVYDKKLRMCVNGTFYTSPDSDNLLISLQTVGQYKAGVQEDMANSPFPEFCPQTAPFALGNKCVTCPGYKLYFSLDALECQSCEAGRYYDSDKRKCVSSYDDSLSIDRMIMNII